MKRSLLLVSTAAAACISAPPATANHSHSSKTTPVVQYGRLEGTVLTPDGVPIWEAGNKGGIHVSGVSEDGRTKFDVATNTQMGGLYRVDLPPGYYDLGIPEGFVNGISYCPQEIYAVEIKPGQRLELNLTINQGNTLTITGKPVYPTPGTARAVEAARAEAEADAAAAAAAKKKASTSTPSTKANPASTDSAALTTATK